MAAVTAGPFPATTPSNISQETPSPFLWRPLLTESRAAIDTYLANLGLQPILDPSNEDRALRRNALRHDVLPMLEQRVPGAAAALARYAALAAEDDALLDALAAAALARSVDRNGGLGTASLLAHHVALRRRIVRSWLENATGSASFSMDRIDAVLRLARSGQSGTTIEIGEGWTVRRERAMLRVGGAGERERERG
jgi:tRNA(Ile)-lysidine synthase